MSQVIPSPSKALIYVRGLSSMLICVNILSRVRSNIIYQILVGSASTGAERFLWLIFPTQFQVFNKPNYEVRSLHDLHNFDIPNVALTFRKVSRAVETNIVEA